ncbi:MAG: iron-containing alcohol dehydrogenase [Gammaproteobacteria bacterium]|nr:iron-containing alcohol dehydrogenase [Gammaproteobacteria bacterium]
MSESFSIGCLPKILFGVGQRNKLAGLITQFGTRALLVTGARSLADSAYGARLIQSLGDKGIDHHTATVSGEPTPELVDSVVTRYRKAHIDVVVGIGGGSAMDTAKAVAGLLPHGNSVMDHLEGVGAGRDYRGPATPLIAVPTTAGTGSEATKNAVLSVHGENGFKKSFRDDALVPNYAVVDPDFLVTCPPAQIAANGLDALTQLMESYVSLRANPLVDALALEGIEKLCSGFFDCHEGGNSDAARKGRMSMSYAALLSGITLAQVGLGSVHGLASPLGAFYPIPHGVACGALLTSATRWNIHALVERDPNSSALTKYAHLGTMIGGAPPGDSPVAWQTLVDTLDNWSQRLAIPRLGEYGVDKSSIGKIVAASRGSSMQTNPIKLQDREIASIVEECL